MTFVPIVIIRSESKILTDRDLFGAKFIHFRKCWLTADITLLLGQSMQQRELQRGD